MNWEMGARYRWIARTQVGIILAFGGPTSRRFSDVGNQERLDQALSKITVI